MTRPVLHAADQSAFPMRPEQPSERFAAEVSPIGQPLGLTQLGAMHVRLEPGKRAFPFHNHLANDEMFVILEGEGSYRFGAEAFPVRAGDVCAAPRGGPDTAHQLVNTGTGVLRYIGISSMNDPDVIEQPDSGKFGVVAIRPGPDFFRAHLRFIGRREDSGDYWAGETL